mmetsp:Transcript_33857/g.86773  ORF Transcript_33857/g.86773 Transcript_33857/m.86773 type:complete len:378 (+) Transcript_33857:811-1944(+)
MALSWSIIVWKTLAVALAYFSQNCSVFVELINLPSFAIVIAVAFRSDSAPAITSFCSFLVSFAFSDRSAARPSSPSASLRAFMTLAVCLPMMLVRFFSSFVPSAFAVRFFSFVSSSFSSFSTFEAAVASFVAMSVMLLPASTPASALASTFSTWAAAFSAASMAFRASLASLCHSCALPSITASASFVESSMPMMSADMSASLSAWPTSFCASASRSSALAVFATAVSFSFPTTASVSFALFTSDSAWSRFLSALAMSVSARSFALLAPVSWSFAIALMDLAPPPVASVSIFLALARSSSACAFKSFAAFSSSAASALTVFADSCSVFALGTMPSTWETSFLAAPIFVSSMLTTWSADFLMVSAAAAAAFSSATSRL